MYSFNSKPIMYFNYKLSEYKNYILLFYFDSLSRY